MRKISFGLIAATLAVWLSAATVVTAQTASKNSAPSATFQKIWVEYDVTDAGRKGMRIHTAFKVFKMKGVSSYLQIKFQKRDGKALMDNNGEFDHEDGSVAAFGILKPGFEPTAYNDFDIFMPYDEFDLPAGKHELQMDVDVIYENGDLIQHLTLYDFDYTQPARTPRAKTDTGASATFEKISVEYDVTESGKRGMRIYTSFKVLGMKGVGSYLQIKFLTRGGKALVDNNGEFVHEDGSVAAFLELKPGFDPAIYKESAIFMPYSELDLVAGRHLLTMDVDVIYKDGKMLSHLTNYDFEYTKP